MSGRRDRSERDRRRRSYGQNFLVDQDLVENYLSGLEIEPGGLVVDIGAGRGALALPLAERGARVWAVERDSAWAQRLATSVRSQSLNDRVRIIRADLRKLRLPKEPYRVIANPPFVHTTALLKLLLDRPDRGPTRADLILQAEVVRKHAASPPRSLLTAAWSPWWTFVEGRTIRRDAFRPKPSVSCAALTIIRRDPHVLPVRLAPTFAETLRPHW